MVTLDKHTAPTPPPQISQPSDTGQTGTGTHRQRNADTSTPSKQRDTGTGSPRRSFFRRSARGRQRERDLGTFLQRGSCAVSAREGCGSKSQRVTLHFPMTLARAQQEADEAKAAVERAQQRADSYRKYINIPKRVDFEPSGSPAVHEQLLDNDAALTLCSHMRAPWTESIRWFGAPRVRMYSRRELALDAAVHVLGLLLALIALIALMLRINSRRPPPLIAWSLLLYGTSLLAMLICSTLFNVGQGYWHESRHKLRCIDHVGICLLIAGTYTPLMAYSCCLSTLKFVWGVAMLTTAAKWSGGCLDRWTVHIPSFLLMGWSCLFVWDTLSSALSPTAVQLLITGGVLYTTGLVPWGLQSVGSVPFEFHIVIWHAFVLSASGCIFWAIYTDIAVAREVPCMLSGR